MLKGYTTPIEIATFLGYDIDDPVLMADVALMTEYAEGCVDTYCDTQMDEENNVVKTYNGNGTGMLTLGLFLRRLESVTVLDINGEPLHTLSVSCQPTPLKTGGAYRWLECRNIRTTPDTVGFTAGGFVMGAGTLFPNGEGNIEVLGDWGFKKGEVPTAVRQAMCYAVKHFFDMRMFNDLAELMAGMGRTVKYHKDVVKTHLPRASRNLLDTFHNSNWMSD